MKARDPDTSLLDRLVAEARAEQAPAVDWETVEASLLKRAAETPRQRRRSPNPALLAAAAVLFAMGTFFALRRTVSEPSRSAEVPEAARNQAPAEPAGRLDGDQLAPGAVVTSGATEVVVEHAGRATWTLAPESSAHVESVGDVVALSLDRGTISAHVVKSPRPESFVVRVERTRVAVHGTRFRVARLSDSVRVDVEEGVVGVGPVGRPGFELRAPDGATLTFDGVRTDVAAGAAPEAETAAAEAASGVAAPALRAKAFALAPVEPDGLPRGALSGIEQVTKSVETCLRDNTVSGDDLRVSIETRLTLRVDAKGAVGEALFAPPLAPSVGLCVDAALEKVRFPRSAGGFVVDRILELNR